MNISDVNRAASPHRRRKRVGRGEASGHGKTAGRGHKGFHQRSAKSLRHTEGGQMPLARRIPKRGFNSARFREPVGAVNVGTLEQAFDAGTTVEPDLLRQRGFVRKDRRVKILGTGDLQKSLTVKAHAFSRSARDKIEQAGGSVEVLR